MRSLVRSALIICPVLVAGSAAAAEYGWSLEAGVGHTDNAAQEKTGTVEDTLIAVGGAVSAVHESRRMEFSLEGSASQVKYVDDTYGDDFVASAFGRAVIGIVPKRFTWTFQDQVGQVSRSLSGTDTPDNRQFVNVFSTGPDILLRPASGDTEFGLAARFQDTRFEFEDGVDEQRGNVSARLLKRLSQRSHWGLVIDASKVDYKLDTTPDYDQQEVYLQLESGRARHTFSIDAGAVRVDEASGANINPLVRAALTRQMRAGWSATVSAGTEVRSTGDRFVEDATDNSSTGYVVITGLPSETLYGSLSLRSDRTRASFGSSLTFTQDDFPGDPTLDRDYWTLALEGSYRMSPVLSATGRVHFDRYEFQGSTDDRMRVSLGLDWQAGRRLFVGFGYRLRIADGTASFGEYTENLVFATLAYRYGLGPGAGAIRF